MYQLFHYHHHNYCNFGSTSVCNAFSFSISGITSLKSESSILFSRLVIYFSLSTDPTYSLLPPLWHQATWYWPSTCIPQTTKLKGNLAAIFLEKHFFNLRASQAITPATYKSALSRLGAGAESF